MTSFTTVDTPLGRVLLLGDDRGLTGLYFEHQPRGPASDPGWRRDDRLFSAARDQLGDYFAGRRHSFDLVLTATGTAFQQRVWQALGEVAFGETVTYGELALRVGIDPAAARAVGAANARNPISIVVPCHRVIGRNGSLTGYGGGLERKRWLLDHECQHRLLPSATPRRS